MSTRKYDWEPDPHGDEYIANHLPDGITASVGLHISEEYWCWEVGIRGAFAISGESSSAQDCIRQVENKIAENLQYVDAEDRAIPYGPFLGGNHKVGHVHNIPSEPLPLYRLIEALSTVTTEITLNELAKSGYRVTAIIPASSDGGWAIVIMERFDDAGNLDVYAELGRRAALEDNQRQVEHDAARAQVEREELEEWATNPAVAHTIMAHDAQDALEHLNHLKSGHVWKTMTLPNGKGYQRCLCGATRPLPANVDHLIAALEAEPDSPNTAA